MINSADILNAEILVVDDKKANVRLLEGMLRVAGYASPSLRLILVRSANFNRASALYGSIC